MGAEAGFHLSGEFLELEPFRRIIHVERMHLPAPTPDNHVETKFDPDGTGTLMTMRMTLPDAQTRSRMLATGMEHGMEASYVRLESTFLGWTMCPYGWGIAAGWHWCGRATRVQRSATPCRLEVPLVDVARRVG